MEVKSRKWLIVCLVWALWIFASSCTVITRQQLVSTASSATHISQEAVSNTWQVVWWVFVKGYHVLEYTVLTLLLIAAFPVLRRYSLGAAGIAVVYACTDEFHQTFVPHRGGHVSDVMIDSLGVVIALMIHALVQRRKLAKANA
jgi:hypothetical protein